MINDFNTTTDYEDLPISLCIVKKHDDTLPVIFMNDACLNLVDTWRGDLYDHAENLTLKDLLPDNGADKLLGLMLTETPPYNYTLKFDHDTPMGVVKKWIKIVIQKQPSQSDKSKEAGIFHIWMFDISEDKYAESLLREALEEADEVSTVKTNFLATMSHEIRTPMQSVFGLLELIDSETKDENTRNMARTARDSANAMMSILDNILDLTKMDADKMELDEFEIPVRTLVRGIIEAVRAHPSKKRITFSENIDESVPSVITGDPLSVRQVIMNLTNNAVKFTKDGEISIHVSVNTEHIPVLNGQIGLRFEIRDTGAGIDQDAQRKLFEPFTQADSSISRQYGGTGLGLSICAKLIELMNGQIGVSSTPGKGSTFWFEIPATEVSTEAQQADLPSLDGITVLSVEDHPQATKEIKYSLEMMGANVTTAPSCAEALALSRIQPFDILIIDQGLPDGLGTELIKDIFAIRPSASMIMYTVRDDEGMRDELTSLGVDYLSKPASRIGLADAIISAVQKNANYKKDGIANILIAEDTESVRDILGRQFSAFQINVDFAENGLIAKEILEQVPDHYDMLITDLHMPEMNGYELVECLRDHSENILRRLPIIAITADIQTTNRNVYLQHNFDECLLKPVSLGQIKRLLIRWNMLSFEAANPPSSGQQRAAPAPITSINEIQNDDNTAISVSSEKIIEQLGTIDKNSLGLIERFLEMTAATISRIGDAAAHDDHPEVASLAHSLKGAAYSACCLKLGDIAKDIQDMAQDDNSAYNDLVKQIPYEIENIKDDLEKLKTQYLG